MKITSFPAECGDAFLCEFESQGKEFRILIDAGTPSTGTRLIELLKVDGKCSKIDILVITHMDNDHIGGVLNLLDDPEINTAIAEIWFNGQVAATRPALSKIQSFSPKQGRKLEDILKADGRWNSSFASGDVSICPNGKPQDVEIGKTEKIQILSPGPEQLATLRRNWHTALEESDKIDSAKKSKLQKFSISKDIAAIAQKDFESDTAYANGSSIAFLLTVGDKRVLFTGDAFPEVICKTAEYLLENPMNIDVFKISHHGSAKNTDSEIIKRFPAKSYLISTNGAHEHPNDECIARILFYSKNCKKIYFNYPSVVPTWEGVNLEQGWQAQFIFSDGKKPVVVLA